MARRAELPELELVPFDGTDDDAGVDLADDRRAGGRSWAVAALAAVGLLGLVGITGREERAVEVLPVPSTLPTTVATTAAPTTNRPRPIFAVPTQAGDAVVVSSGTWSGTIRIPAELGFVKSVATARTFVVVALTSGQVRRYSRDEPDGTLLGEADLVIPNAGDRTLAWAIRTIGDHQVVRTIVAAPATEGITRAVPPGWRVGGSTDGNLVLSRATAAGGVALWDVWNEAEPVVLDDGGQYLASSRRKVAWIRDGVVVVASRPYASVGEPLPTTRVAVAGELVAGRFSPDSEHLAVIGPAQNGYGVHVLSAGNYDGGFVVPVTTPPAFGWTSRGELLVAAGALEELRYNPETDVLTANGRNVVPVPPVPLPLPA